MTGLSPELLHADADLADHRAPGQGPITREPRESASCSPSTGAEVHGYRKMGASPIQLGEEAAEFLLSMLYRT